MGAICGPGASDAAPRIDPTRSSPFSSQVQILARRKRAYGSNMCGAEADLSMSKHERHCEFPETSAGALPTACKYSLWPVLS